MGGITMTMQHQAPGVRSRGSAGVAAPALAGELARPALVERLAARWSVPLTVIVGGAGFGKSTLLAQVGRATAIAPPGIEAGVSCEPAHQRAEELAAAIHAALGAPRRAGDPLVATLELLRRQAPLAVCVALDDVHLLGRATSGARLLRELTARLPSNAHLVLAGRTAPDVPLARLRAADRVLELDERDLAFTPTEVARLAATFRRPVADAVAFGGWPALVRVALAARPGVALGYAREEVLADLGGDDRHALLALAVVGPADEDLVSRVLGRPVDLDRLSTLVPMVDRVGDATFRAHGLWLDALARTVDPVEAATVRRRAVDELLAAGLVERAGDAAVAGGDWTALSRAAGDLVRTTLSVLPIEPAQRWLAAATSAGVPASPELRLLAAARRTANDFGDRSVDAVLDTIADDVRACDDPTGEVTALAVATIAAQARGDTDRLIAVALRTAGVPGADRHPIVRLAVASIAAVVAEMQGDPERAVEELAAVPVEGVPAPLTVSSDRFLMHCLLLAGRADEAVAVVGRSLADAPSEHCRSLAAFTRWAAGDPTGFVDGPFPEPAGASDRDTFVARAFHAVIGSSVGVLVPFEDGRPWLDNPRDAAVVANARAAHAVLRHDEVTAAAALAAVALAHPGDRLAERHLRRFLALGFVLDDGWRARWEAAELGPAHERAREVARLFRALRAGSDATSARVEAPHVCTVLPLPWSVELACRLHERGSPDGARLLEWLLERIGGRAHAELRDAADAGDRRLAAGAASLLARVPKEPTEPLAIDVLGPLRLRRDGVPCVDGVRRQRVRELLTMLVVDGTVTRDRAVDVLWPDLDPDSGARNLRVTLSYLRRLLEPDRSAGEASFHLRTDAASIRLVPSSKLVVDLWELPRLAADAAAARAGGDVAAAVTLLAAAAALFRGAPLTDLDRLPGYEAAVERTRLLQVSCALELGALRLTTGDAAGALTDAERALALEPYLEAAHRLAIAAAVQRGDRTRALAAVHRATAAFDELGVAPDAATQMVIRAATPRGALTQLAS